MEEFNDKKFMSFANVNLAHTCGNVCAVTKDIFKSNFPDNFFKYENVSTEVAVKQFKKIKNFRDFKYQKPYVLMEPKILFADPTEAHIDFYRRLYGVNVTDVLRPTRQRAKFFYDEDKGSVMDFTVERLKMSFQFTIVLSTEYQQYNVAGHMINSLRIEHPFYQSVMLETIIPDSLIKLVSNEAGIPVYDEDGKPFKFLNYLNSRSNIPIVVEFQPATGFYKFRMVNKTTLLMKYTNLDVGDGDGDGMIKDSYPISINVDMEFNYVSGFVFVAEKEQAPTFDLNVGSDSERSEAYLSDTVLSLDSTIFHTIQKVIIPNYDASERKLKEVIAFISEAEEDEIDLHSVLETEYIDIMKKLKEEGVPYSIFININIYEDEKPKNDEDYFIDYETLTLKIKKTKEYMTYRMAIYVNSDYLNEYRLRNHDYC